MDHFYTNTPTASVFNWAKTPNPFYFSSSNNFGNKSINSNYAGDTNYAQDLPFGDDPHYILDENLNLDHNYAKSKYSAIMDEDSIQTPDDYKIQVNHQTPPHPVGEDSPAIDILFSSSKSGDFTTAMDVDPAVPLYPSDAASTQDSIEEEEKNDSQEEFAHKMSLRPASHGLPNLGNTCYMNSVLQCLFNTQELKSHFMKSQHDYTDSLADSFTQVMLSSFLRRIPEQALRGALYSFKRALEKVAPIFQGFDQNDAHEFFRLLIEKIHDELNKAPKKSLPYSEFKPSQPDLSLKQMAAEWTHYSQDRDQSLVTDIFGGLILNEVTCVECGHVSYTFEDSLDFSLNLANTYDVTSSIPNPIANLYSCFKEFTSQEPIDGYKCSKCSKKNTTYKRTTIWRQPEMLVVQFKRFVYDMTGDRKAVKDKVSFPLDGLTLDDFMHEKSNESRRKYKLYAVVNHFGGLEFGHYIAYIFNEQQNSWMKYNDDQTTLIDEKEMIKFADGAAEPYVLFYKRV